MASCNGQFLLFDALPFLGPLPLDLLRRRRVGVVGAASGIGTNLDHLSALAAVHDDGLSHLVAWFLVRGELATCTICFRLFDLQLDVLIPPQGSAFAGIPRRRNLDELRFGFQSLSHGSLDLAPETAARSAFSALRMSTSGNKSVTRSLTLIKCRQRQRLETATDAVARPRSSA